MSTPLLLGIFLGLWAMVYSTPVNSATQIPIKSEEDVLREAMTDGFLVEQFLPPSLKSEPLQKNSPTQQSNQTSSGREESRNQSLLMEIREEGSASGDTLSQPWDEDYSTTSERNLSSSNSSTTLSPTSDWPSSSESNATQSSHITEPTVPSQTDDPESFYSGSGNGELLDHYATTKASKTYTGSFSTIGRQDPEDEDLESGSGFGMPKDQGKTRTFEFPSVQGDKFSHLPENDDSAKTEQHKGHVTSGDKLYHVPENDDSAKTEQHKGHVTPDWVIILGFVVGVAALVMLCAAIATRDKWNGPRQASNPQTGVDSSQQQKAENESFLQKDTPRENGKVVEYTVIPLDELPEKYSD